MILAPVCGEGLVAPFQYQHPPPRHWTKRDWPKALGHALLFMNIVRLQAAYRPPAVIKPHDGHREIKAMACATGAAQPRPQK